MTAAFETLVAWVRAAGGHVGALGVGLCGGVNGGERGLFTTEAASEGALLLRVPHACIVTPDVAAESAPGRMIAARFEGGSEEQVLLAAWLLHQRDRPEAHWAPYLATLPERVPTHPFFYDRARVHALRGTSLEALVPARRAFLLEELGWLRAHVPAAAGWTDDAWLLVRTLVTSRLFGLEGTLGNALVPLADLCNHALAPGAVWGLAGDEFVLHASSPLGAGGEVHEGYGAKSNLRLLLHYGFTLADNPEEDCIVEVEGQPVQLGGAPTDESVREAVEGLAWDGDEPRLRAALAGVCAARLAGLPPEEEDAADEAFAADAVRVRRGERRVLAAWCARLA
jgi:hypothetical protein